MRILIRALPLALAASLLMLFAFACEGGGGDQSSHPNGDTSGDLVSSAPREVLSASAESFQEDVRSLRADLEATVTIGGFALNASSDLAFQAPDQMHATMELGGLGTFEMLLLGTDLYVNMPGRDWVQISLDDAGLGELGLDAPTLEKFVGDHSMVDYQQLVKSMGGEVEDLGDETLDGDRFEHYRTTLDFRDMAGAFSDAFGAVSNLGLDGLSGPLTLDLWVDPDTTLPHRITANGEFAFGESSMLFEATMRFFGYNEPVQIPGAPPDAVPFALLGGP